MINLFKKAKMKNIFLLTLTINFYAYSAYYSSSVITPIPNDLTTPAQFFRYSYGHEFIDEIKFFYNRELNTLFANGAITQETATRLFQAIEKDLANYITLNKPLITPLGTVEYRLGDSCTGQSYVSDAFKKIPPLERIKLIADDQILIAGSLKFTGHEHVKGIIAHNQMILKQLFQDQKISEKTFLNLNKSMPEDLLNYLQHNCPLPVSKITGMVEYRLGDSCAVVESAVKKVLPFILIYEIITLQNAGLLK